MRKGKKHREEEEGEEDGEGNGGHCFPPHQTNGGLAWLGKVPIDEQASHVEKSYITHTSFRWVDRSRVEGQKQEAKNVLSNA